MWIGLKSSNQGDFRWMVDQSTTSSYSNFDKGEPNGVTSSRWGGIRATGTWDDNESVSDKFPLACQTPAAKKYRKTSGKNDNIQLLYLVSVLVD